MNTESNTQNNSILFDDEKLLEMYVALPQSIKSAMFSVNVAEKIMRIGKKYGLSIDQIGELGHATGTVMVGTLHPRSFIQELEKQLRVDRAKATDIGKEINHEIFFPIREELKKLHSMEDTDEILSGKEIEKGDALKSISERRIIGKIPEGYALEKDIPEPPTVESGIKNQESSVPKIPPISPPQNLPTQPEIKSEQKPQKSLGSGSRSLEEKFSKNKFNTFATREPQIRPIPEWAKPKEESGIPDTIRFQRSYGAIKNQESSVPKIPPISSPQTRDRDPWQATEQPGHNQPHQQSETAQVWAPPIPPTQPQPPQKQSQPRSPNSGGDQYREPIE